MAILPHLTFTTSEPVTLASELVQNATATVDALSMRIVGSVVTVQRYSATGATTTKIAIPLRTGATAFAVLLVRAQATNDQGADLGALGRLNFVHGSPTTLNIYEPSGLAANTLYDLTFLILETQ